MSPIARVAREIAELGPVARHSRRPALMATALAAAAFGLLPDDPRVRTVAVAALVGVAEASLRLLDGFGPRGEGDRRPVAPVIDRAAGMWCACWPLPPGPIPLGIAFGLYLAVSRRGSGPGARLRRGLGRTGAIADVLLGLLAGLLVRIVSKTLYTL